jgi:hypothetical protein
VIAWQLRMGCLAALTGCIWAGGFRDLQDLTYMSLWQRGSAVMR